MLTPHIFTFKNNDLVPMKKIPVYAVDFFSGRVLTLVSESWRLTALFGIPSERPFTAETKVSIVAVLAQDDNGDLTALRTEYLARPEYPSLTCHLPEAALFEREIAEQWGITPLGHPDLRPLRYVRPYLYFPGHKQPFGLAPENPAAPARVPLRAHDDPAVYYPCIGPVREPFSLCSCDRFACYGEHILSMERAQGYGHRGIEEALTNGAQALPLIECIAGDETLSQALSYVHIIETLSGTHSDAYTCYWRTLLVELERLNHHAQALSALAGSIDYAPAQAYFGRVAEAYADFIADVCGNRSGRGAIAPGRVAARLQEAQIFELAGKLRKIAADADHAAWLLFQAVSVNDRFENTGRIGTDVCRELGSVGSAARASNVRRDVRSTHPSDAYTQVHNVLCYETNGDVRSRAHIRWREMQNASSLMMAMLSNLPAPEDDAAPVAETALSLQPNSFSVSLLEGCRGETVHCALTDAQGKFFVYKIVTASFRNSAALHEAMRNDTLSNSGLIGESFALSSAAFDL